jgi:hypothetical protein
MGDWIRNFTLALRRLSVVFAVGTTACQHTHILPEGASTALRSAADSPTILGGLVYQGTVTRRGTDATVLFRYERRVLDLDEGLRSSHVTLSAAGTPVVMQRADHSASYELSGFQEIHVQTGLVGQVDMGVDGTATYRTTVDGRTRTHVEPPGEPLHVGPTLFGYALENWDSLVAGNTHAFRFAVLQQRRSYRFELRKIDGPDGTTTFEMSPTNRLVALAVPPAQLVFGHDRNILQYAGLVPPLQEVGSRLKRLDAAVTYEHTSEVYR